MPMDNKGVNRALDKMKTVLRNTPRKVAVTAKNFYSASFDEGGFRDEGLQKWEARKSRKDDKGRAILVKTNTLAKEIRITRVSSRVIELANPLEYAPVHNDGGDIDVKAHSRTRKGRKYQVKGYTYKMPKRQFIGKSQTLNDRLTKMIVRDVLNCFK